MSQLLQQFTEKFCKTSVPDIRPGYQVRVHQKIQEGNKTRVQVFQGMVIATSSGHGVNDTFTVRKVSEGIGVEKVFPIHSPLIVKIDVQRAHKTRRSKLNFLRDLSGKALRLKEIPFQLREKEFAGGVGSEVAGDMVEETAPETETAPAPEAPAEEPVQEETPKPEPTPEEAPEKEQEKK
ncbi:50S ribosomal protein L19 [Candidatus Gracilibacteria bacterium]|nr:50S ribosomal protein L19 [Candidatus Gracilibacteria bacterium]